MKKPKNVPVEAIFNSNDNQWELGNKNSKGKKVGKWNFWWVTTGHHCCHTIYKGNSEKNFTYTRFHPDGTYSQKGTYINGKLNGTVYYQKSNSKTTELALTEPLYKNVFRAICEIQKGQAVSWKYFNKEGVQIGLDGNAVLTIKEFSSNFPGFKVPIQLLLLLEFEQEFGAFGYANGFYLSNNDKSLIETYSKNKEFLNKLMAFATANGTGSVYAFWNEGDTKGLSEMPIVVIGDEGGEHVIAINILDFLQLLAYDQEITVDHDEAFFYKDTEDYEKSHNAEIYLKWLKTNFNLNRIDSPKRIIKRAQDKFKKSFKDWVSIYLRKAQ